MEAEQRRLDAERQQLEADRQDLSRLRGSLKKRRNRSLPEKQETGLWGAFCQGMLGL